VKRLKQNDRFLEFVGKTAGSMDQRNRLITSKLVSVHLDRGRSQNAPASRQLIQVELLGHQEQPHVLSESGNLEPGVE
jgi:hypothetical protein